MMDKNKRCKAKSKRNGNQCKQFVVSGYEVCYYHGANPQNHGGAPKGNKNAVTHGAYVNKLLDDQEETLIDEYSQRLDSDFALNDSSDRMSAKLACIYFVRWIRAIKGGNAETMYKMDSLLRNQLKDLKATKDKLEGETINLNTTPVEWAANLLDKVRKARAEKESIGR